MKLLTVIGLFLDLVGVMILGMGEVMKGAASLRSLKESYKDSFEYDIQQRPWYVRPLLRLGATLGARTIGAQRQPPPYRAFPLTAYGVLLPSRRISPPIYGGTGQCYKRAKVRWMAKTYQYKHNSFTSDGTQEERCIV